MEQTRKQIEENLEAALQKACPDNRVKRVPVKGELRNGLGVFSSSLPFAAAKQLGTSPLSAARILLSHLPDDPLFETVRAQSGYINFVPSDRWYAQAVSQLVLPAGFSPVFTEEDLLCADRLSPTDRAVSETFLRLCSRLRHLRFLGYDGAGSSFGGSFGPEEKALLFSLCRIGENRSSFPALTETAQSADLLLALPVMAEEEQMRFRCFLLFAAGSLMAEAFHSRRIIAF